MGEGLDTEFNANSDGQTFKAAQLNSRPDAHPDFFAILGLTENPTDDEIKDARRRVFKHFGGVHRAPKRVQNALARIEDSTDRRQYKDLLDAVTENVPLRCQDEEEVKRRARACRWAEFELYPDPGGNPCIWYVRRPSDGPPPGPEHLRRATIWSIGAEYVNRFCCVASGYSCLTLKPKPPIERLGWFLVSLTFWACVFFCPKVGIIALYHHHVAGVAQERFRALHDLQNDLASASLKLDEVKVRRDAVRGSFTSTLGIDPTADTLPAWFREILDSKSTANEAWVDVQKSVPSDGELVVRRAKLAAADARLKEGTERKEDADEVIGISAWADEQLKLLSHQDANRNLINQYVQLSQLDEEIRTSKTTKGEVGKP